VVYNTQMRHLVLFAVKYLLLFINLPCRHGFLARILPGNADPPPRY